MIHYLTIHHEYATRRGHHGGSKWIDLQLRQINKNTTDYKVWSYCTGFDFSPYRDKFHYCDSWQCKGIMNEGNSMSSNHSTKLDDLTAFVCNDPDNKVKDDDILIWLDSDAFPINNVNNYVTEKLSKYPLLGVNRKENPNNDVIPHPSFVCSTARFWRIHQWSWSGCQLVRHLSSRKRFNTGGTHDTGGKLYLHLLINNIDWYRMHRTHSLTEHPINFTIYDDLVYHHGSGSRGASSRWDLRNSSRNKRGRGIELRIGKRKLPLYVFDVITRDDDFFDNHYRDTLRYENFGVWDTFGKVYKTK